MESLLNESYIPSSGGYDQIRNTLSQNKNKQKVC